MCDVTQLMVLNHDSPFNGRHVSQHCKAPSAESEGSYSINDAAPKCIQHLSVPDQDEVVVNRTG